MELGVLTDKAQVQRKGSTVIASRDIGGLLMEGEVMCMAVMKWLRKMKRHEGAEVVTTVTTMRKNKDSQRKVNN